MGKSAWGGRVLLEDSVTVLSTSSVVEVVGNAVRNGTYFYAKTRDGFWGRSTSPKGPFTWVPEDEVPHMVFHDFDTVRVKKRKIA